VIKNVQELHAYDGKITSARGKLSEGGVAALLLSWSQLRT